MSDDNRVYRRGKDEYTRLLSLRNKSADYQRLFEAWEKYGWGKGPLPEEPKAEPAFRTGESK